jgi:hypothetical protein
MPPDNNTNYFPTHLGEVAAIRSWISAGALDN